MILTKQYQINHSYFTHNLNSSKLDFNALCVIFIQENEIYEGRELANYLESHSARGMWMLPQTYLIGFEGKLNNLIDVLKTKFIIMKSVDELELTELSDIESKEVDGGWWGEEIWVPLRDYFYGDEFEYFMLKILPFEVTERKYFNLVTASSNFRVCR